MHQSDSFIDEVSEEVRRDSLYRLLRRYGWLLAALVVTHNMELARAMDRRVTLRDGLVVEI